MAESSMNFGNMTFTGGIQNFGGQNTNTQQNNYADLSPREQIDVQLAALREAFPDTAPAQREISVIEEGLAQPSPESRHRLDAALRRLAENAGSARTATEAIAAIGALVAAHWPL